VDFVLFYSLGGEWRRNALMLRPRLLHIAKDIKASVNTEAVLDIGTDHALLPVWLIKNGCCKKVIATDIKEGPLKKAALNVAKHGVADQVSLFIGDGFDAAPDVEDGYYAVISGIGGVSLTKILENGRERAVKAGTIALQPMNNLPYVRYWLNNNGYSIKYEKLAEEGRRIYSLIFCAYTGIFEEYTRAEYLVGKRFTDCPDELFIRYTGIIMKRLEKTVRGLAKSRRDKQANGLRV
jgi:tRNA (adenine22-N1)-methyltransferase